MNPWTPMKNPCDLKHLGKLGEELGECSAIVSRCIIQGIDGEEPGSGKPNKRWLEEEIADVLASMEVVINRFKLDIDFIEARSEKKVNLLRQWHSMLEI